MANKEKRNEILRAVKYFMIAASAGAIELITFTIFTEFTQWTYWPCYLTALVLSVLWNFTLNRRYTFRSNNNVSVAMMKVFAYYMVFTPVSTILGNYLAETAGWNEYLVTVLNMLINGVTEYLYQRFFVFGKSIDNNKLAEKQLVKQQKQLDITAD